MTEMESKKDIDPPRYESGMGERLVRLEVEREHSATKADLKDVENRLGKRISDSEQGLRKEISDVEDGLRKEISGVKDELRKEISDLKVELKGEIKDIKVWVLSGVIGVSGIVFGLMRLLG